MAEPVYQHEPDPRITGEHVADVCVVDAGQGRKVEILMVADGGCCMIVAWWLEDLRDVNGDPVGSKRVLCGSYWNRSLALSKWNRRNNLSRDMSVFENMVEVPLR